MDSMKQHTKELRDLARRVVALLPAPMAVALRTTKRAVLNQRSPRDVFAKIAESNAWDGTESVSGPGSTLEATQLLRAALPALLASLGVQRLLDIPCGDSHWISQTLPDGITYIGGDILPKLIDTARIQKNQLGRFEVLDLVNDDLPRADLVMVRDCLIHLPNAMVLRAIANIKRSGASYLLTTHFLADVPNIDIEIGGYRPVDLCKAPFSLPQPRGLLNDFDGRNQNGKHMALWRCEDL